jgi:hypothetical protein
VDLGILGESKTSELAGGGGVSKKTKDQTDTFLLSPGSRTRAIIKHVLKGRPPFSYGYPRIKPIHVPPELLPEGVASPICKKNVYYYCKIANWDTLRIIDS